MMTTMSDQGPIDGDREKVASRWGEEPDAAVNWATIPYVNRRAAEMIGADPARGFWVHMLDLYSDPRRPLNRVLSLACGHGHQERTLAKYRQFRVCDALDISETALENARRLAEAEGLRHINYECHDLNELKLSHTYDAVIAGGIHHIKNLEHLFEEIKRWLAPGGFFLMYEYIGPSQCQPTARQLEAINACIRLLPKKYRVRISAQRRLGVTTPEEALALLESPDFRPPEPQEQPPVPASDAPREGSAPLDAATGNGTTVTAEPEAPPKKGLARALYLLHRAALAIRRGDLRYRLKAYVLRGLQEPTPPPPAPIEPAAVESAPIAPAPEWIADDLPEEYFWTKFVPMTREQWSAVDPSESVRSDEIISLLRKSFSTVDVRYTGGSIMQFTLYDIAGNFYADTEETRDILDMLFKIEEVLLKHDDVPHDYAVIVAKND